VGQVATQAGQVPLSGTQVDQVVVETQANQVLPPVGFRGTKHCQQERWHQQLTATWLARAKEKQQEQRQKALLGPGGKQQWAPGTWRQGARSPAKVEVPVAPAASAVDQMLLPVTQMTQIDQVAIQAGQALLGPGGKQQWAPGTWGQGARFPAKVEVPVVPAASAVDQMLLPVTGSST